MVRLRSLNLRGSYNSMIEIGAREEEVDIFYFQEVVGGEGERFYSLDGYEVLRRVGEYIKKEQGSVVSMLISKRW